MNSAALRRLTRRVTELSVIYKERITTPKMAAFAMIIAGALVLRLGSGG